MGDENSLAGTTKAHKHTSPASDGGFLETTETGVTNMSAGSIGYYSGSSVLTELTAGNSADVLTMGATNPSWSAPSSSGWSSIYSATGLTTLDFQSNDMLDYRYFDIMMYFGSSGAEPVEFQFYNADGGLFGSTAYGTAGWFRDTFTSDANVSNFNASFGNDIGASGESDHAWQCHLRINSYAGTTTNYQADVAIEINQRWVGGSYEPLCCIGNGFVTFGSVTSSSQQTISGIKMVSPTSQTNGIVDIYGLGSSS